MGQWYDGGNDARLYAGFAKTGQYSLRLRDNNGIESSIYYTKDVRAYSSFSITLSLLAKLCSATDTLFLETAASLTGAWTVRHSWVFNTVNGFQNNVRVQLSKLNTNLPSSKNPFYVRLRARTLTNLHVLYLDDIVLTFY